MSQCNILNVKLPNSQFNKLKSGIKNDTLVTINLSSGPVGESNDETNYPHKSLLINTQVSKIRKAFPNELSANIKFSKLQLSRMIQLGGFLSTLLVLLLKTGLPVIGNVRKPLAESILVILELAVAVSATDADIYKKISG